MAAGKKKARGRKRRPTLDEVADALYRATDSEKALRLLASLTVEQRAEVSRKVDARIAADKAKLGF